MDGVDQKSALIDSAARLFQSGGYSATGARDIASAAGVPHGSFTNHFRSKEALGVAALDAYFARLQMTMEVTLRTADRPAALRLQDYFDVIAERLGKAGWQVGCLIPDLAAEMPARSDILRRRLIGIMEEQVGAFERILAEIVGQREAPDLASFLVAAWHGTLLRMKVERGPEPLLRFQRVLRDILSARAVETEPK